MPPRPNELAFDDLLRAGLRVPLQDEQAAEEPNQDMDGAQTTEE